MRTVTRMLAIAAVAMFAAGSAQAAATLNIFINDGDNDAIACETGGCTNTGLIAAGTTVVFDVFLTVGPEGISSYQTDVTTGGAGTFAGIATNVGINVPYSTVNCPGSQACSLAQLAAPVPLGDRVNVFNLATLGNGPIGGTYRVARVNFTFNSSGQVSLANTIMFSNAGLGVAVSSNAGVTVIVPEPTTVALLGLGLFGLAVAGRRRA